MDEKAFHRVTPVIAIAGVLITAGCHLLGGWPVALGSIGGVVLALLNWQGIRWVARKIATGSTQKRSMVMALLTLKMGVLGVTVWLALRVLALDAVGLCAGLSALVVGLFVATLTAHAAAPAGES